MSFVSDLKRRAESAERDLAAAAAEVDRLTKLNTEIHEAKDAVGEQLRAAESQRDAARAEGLEAGRQEGVAAVLAERALWQKPAEQIRAEGRREVVELVERYCESITALPADGFTYVEVAERRTAALHPDRALGPLLSDDG